MHINIYNDLEDNVENVSHKVKMLESVVINLSNKFNEEIRILKEKSKAIRSDIKNLKPSFADLFKQNLEKLLITLLLKTEMLREAAKEVE